MGIRRTRPGGFLGRTASFLAAILAVFTLVASGASHELLHNDDRDAVGRAAVAEQAVVEAVRLAHGHGAQAGAPPAKAHTGGPVHACAGHCGAHAVGEAPAPAALPSPALERAAWRLDRGTGLGDHPTTGPDRPPRA